MGVISNIREAFLRRGPDTSYAGDSEPYGGNTFTRAAAVKHQEYDAMYGSGGYGLGTWNGQLGAFLRLPGSDTDFAAEAGDLWRGSIVAALINRIASNVAQAHPCLYTIGPDQKPKYTYSAPFLDLLDHPNEFFGPDEHLHATLIGLICDGNAYWLKERSGSGKVVELRNVPFFQFRPRWLLDGSQFIGWYEYYLNGSWQRIEVVDVVHLRWGQDPRNQRKGLGPLLSALREIVTDEQASAYAAAIAKNGIGATMISPKGDVFIDKPVREEIAEQYNRKAGRDARGSVVVNSHEMTAQNIGYSPEQIMITDIRMAAEVRCCSLLGVPPEVMPFLIGMEHSTYNNKAEAFKAFWTECVIPLQHMIGRQLRSKLLPDFTNDRSIRIGWDYRDIRALQEEEDAKAKRIVGLAGGPVISVDEGREDLGLKPTGRPEDAEVRANSPAPAMADPAADANTDPAQAKLDAKKSAADAKKSADKAARAARFVRYLDVGNLNG